MKTYPALDLRGGPTDLVLAAVDDFSPTAIEERDDVLRAFFASSTQRDAARTLLAAQYEVEPVDVPDEDWARRSQENLQPVTIGCVTIRPQRGGTSEFDQSEVDLSSEIRNLKSQIALVIPPSMGFGTGHHATTRLCIEALQTVDLAGARVLDVGTGSGILAIAAAALGASRALGIDPDEDAIAAARENLAHNPGVAGITFAMADLSSMGRLVSEVLGAPADIVTANLTGGLLVRSVHALVAATRPGGVLILSGLLAGERDGVINAFGPAPIVRERREDEWVCLVVKKS